MVIQGVGHVFHPPVALDRWPSDDQRSRLVFITETSRPTICARCSPRWGRCNPDKDHERKNDGELKSGSRILAHAELVYAETPDMAYDKLRNGHADALAQACPVLLEYSSQLPASRVLAERYGDRITSWVTELRWSQGPAADERRAHAMRRIAAEPGRMPDLRGLGPEAPSDESTRRFLLGED